MNRSGNKLFSALIWFVRIIVWLYYLFVGYYVLMFIVIFSSGKTINIGIPDRTILYIGWELIYYTQLFVVLVFSIISRFRYREVNVYLLLNVLFAIPEFIYIVFKYTSDANNSGYLFG